MEPCDEKLKGANCQSKFQRRVMCADCKSEIKLVGDGKSCTKGTSIRFGVYYDGPAICETCIDGRYDKAADIYESK